MSFTLKRVGGKRQSSRVAKRHRGPPGAPKRVAFHGELKFRDTFVGDTNLTVAGQVFNTVVQIAQGPGESERIGRKVRIRHVSIRGKMRMQSTATPNSMSNLWRFLVVQDRQSNGAAPGFTQVIQNGPILNFANLENSQRFRILADVTRPISASAAFGDGTTNGSGEITQFFKLEIPVNIRVEYDSLISTGAIASIRTNNITVLVNALSGTEPVIVQFTSRVLFTDN